MENKFKVGDKVRRIIDGGNISNRVTKGNIYEVVGIHILGYITLIDDTNTKDYFYSDNFELVESKNKTLTNEKMDMEDLKTFNPKNLAEGKIQAEEERANYEAKQAKEAYTNLVNNKEEQERIVKVANENIKEIKENLKIFK